MKIVIVIPAFNEEDTIASVISDIPKFEESEVLVIDDGSLDSTAERARQAGVARVFSFPRNRGLAQAFKKGVEIALEMGADIIVTIDADGQYDAKEIPLIVQPILDGKGDMVLGSRFKGWIEGMPIVKRIGNRIATKVTASISGYPVTDAQTGFRAFSRGTALKFNVLAHYTYTQETIIQAAKKGVTIVEVPCSFRKRQGKSRLITSVFTYAGKVGLTVLTTYRDYEPLKTFMIAGISLFALGLLTGARVLVHFFTTGMVTPYVPTAILTSILLTMGFQMIVLALFADMIGNSRKLQEEILQRLKEREF